MKNSPFPGAFTAATLASFVLMSCGGGGTSTTDNSQAVNTDASWSWNLPVNFATPAVPADNPMSEEKFQLGRYLFHDTRLSGNGTQSCASCHLQSLAFTDGKAVATGSTGEHTARSAMPIANVAYHPTFNWANSATTTLEQQMETPLFATSPVELGINDSNRAAVLKRFQDDSDYVARFGRAFPGETSPINFTNIIKAIATFERGMLSGDAKYDRYQKGQATLTASEERGRNLFFTEKAECFHCHGSFNFNDQLKHAGSRSVETPFHNTGLYNIDGKGGFPAPNRGIFELTGKAEDMGAFRAQSLRNVAVTAPYMHDGSIATLEEVLDFYAAGGRHITSGPLAGDGRNNPYKSDLISRIDLDAQEKADLIAFLKTLTDENLLTSSRFSNPFK
ncbi:methanobactin export MATE transporter MbnM [Zoogloea sp.]|uniref:methanobactin export MATE transporter MbnM n=1 Tax=Zoogloea sp. TaxID=49181 RepID=UPI0025EADAE9|nr:methanobactin export MATE transporter MbnM [Zoogloea sp.]MCK6393023.1 di-heme enzyme [Zoogloea sp.]